MGSFSVWHLLIVLVGLIVPLFFILKAPPAGPNRFGEPPSPMNFGDAIGSFFKNYTNFNDRASRSQFWYAWLFVFLVTFVLDLTERSGVASGLWALAVAIPSLAIAARRLHDINRSGWHQLLGYLFPVGTIALIVWYCKPALDGVGAPTINQRPTTLNNVEVLERLAKLRSTGAISSEEYEVEKGKLLRK